MIRDVVLHLMSEQPLLADLDALPTPADSLIICSNLRLMNGNRPIFVDDSASTFVFPVEFVRFIEVPTKALAGLDRAGRAEPGRAPSRDAGREMVPIALPERMGAAGEAAETGPGPDEDLEIDEDFLRRIRDV